MSIRKALGAVKDQASIGIAKVSGAILADVDIAIVRATAHDDGPADRHVREVLRLTSSGGGSRIHVAACVASVSRRLSKTRDYVVAAKCLSLLHRLVSDGDPHFRHEIVRPTLSTGGRRGAPGVLAALSYFRDEAHSASWDHSAFVRAYSVYLDERVRYLLSLLPAPRTVRFADDEDYGGGSVSLHEMDAEALLTRARQLRELMNRALACRPTGAATHSRVVLATLHAVARESAEVYADVSVVLAVLLDRFFDMDYSDCVKTFEAYVSTARLVEDLLVFYSWCHDVGVARSSVFAEVKRVEEKLLETLEHFLRERGRAGQSSSPHHVKELKALPAPEMINQSELVDLREETTDEQGDTLALALFSEPAMAKEGEWVAFTSACETESGKADWELALVETASNLPRQTVALGGGMDTLLLHGMYDHGVARQQARRAQGSASSVALLALPGPETTTGGDPFAASLAVPPPSYVQMAEMERKQQLLAQEQQMWAQYRHGGMQGQAGINGLAVGGGGSLFAAPTTSMAYHGGAAGYHYY